MFMLETVSAAVFALSGAVSGSCWYPLSHLEANITATYSYLKCVLSERENNVFESI